MSLKWNGSFRFGPIRWSNLIGPTEFLSICQIVVPNTALLYPAYKHDNQTLGTLNWVVIYRSFRGI